MIFLINIFLNALFLVHAGFFYLASKKADDQRAIFMAKICAATHSVGIASQIVAHLGYPNTALFITVLGILFNLRLIWAGIQLKA